MKRLAIAAAFLLSLLAFAPSVHADSKPSGNPDQPGSVQTKTPDDKTGKSGPVQKDEHPPQIGVVTQVVGYVTVYRWPYGWITVPVTRTYYIVVVWNPRCSCYGVYDAAGNFYPYYGPLLGDAPTNKPKQRTQPDDRSPGK